MFWPNHELSHSRMAYPTDELIIIADWHILARNEAIPS